MQALARVGGQNNISHVRDVGEVQGGTDGWILVEGVGELPAFEFGGGFGDWGCGDCCEA